ERGERREEETRRHVHVGGKDVGARIGTPGGALNVVCGATSANRRPQDQGNHHVLAAGGSPSVTGSPRCERPYRLSRSLSSFERARLATTSWPPVSTSL